MKSTATLVRRRRERRLQQVRQNSSRTLRAGVSTVVLLLLGVVVVVVGSAGTAVGIYIYYARDLPEPAAITKVNDQFETTLIYDRTGKTVLYQIIDPNGGDRQSIALSDIPKDLINATISFEDKTFYSNPGFDVRGIIRAVWIALQSGSTQGGSTITQQLIKNTLFPPKERVARTLDRKIKEVILSGEIARRYNKDQILEWYLNTNFYGNLAYGIDAAAKLYFAKPAHDLTLGEAAMLAAIPQDPQFNPIDNPVKAKERQLLVLQTMVDNGYITNEEATQVAGQPTVIRPITENYGIIAPHFSQFARHQAEDLLNQQGMDGGRLVAGGGLRIFTTLDLDLQYQAECVTRAYVTRISGGSPTAAPNTSVGEPCRAAAYLPNPPNFQMGVKRNVTNAASLVLRPSTGEILSMVGSLDFWNVGIDGNFNAAVNGLRQPGSAFKPFVYVTAFALRKYMPASMVLDVPTTFNSAGTDYTPVNEDRTFHGPMNLRKALANSYNIPAVQVLANVGIGNVIRTARQFGINSLRGNLDQYGLALALGSAETSLLDMTYAYSVFANLGYMAGMPVANPLQGFRAFDPVAVLRIEDKDGNILWQFGEKNGTFGRQNIVDDSLAYLINNVLSDSEARLPAFGIGNALELSRPAAVKTGTTNDNRDAWTVGYTPQLVTGVWVGNNNNAPMADDLTGSTGAAPIWHAIMEYAHARDSLPVQDWKRPPTVIEQTVCQDSGLLPTLDCPKVKELFISAANYSTVPTQQDIYWKRYQINSRNGLIATAFTPVDLVISRLYFDYPPEAVEWAKSAGKPLPPTQYDSGGGQAVSDIATILAPIGLARVRGVVDVRGVIDAVDATSYTLAYGAGINPTKWISINSGLPKVSEQEISFGSWDTTGLDGLYTLRLTIVLKDQTFEPFTVQLTVDNQPPTLRIISPHPGDTVSAGAGAIHLEVEATDNVEMAYVEFYQDGQLVATIKGENGVFKTDVKITATGTPTFTMIAYDEAGNTIQSDKIQVTVTNN